MKQQWLPPTPEEEALQQPDYTPWDFVQSVVNPSNISKGMLSFAARPSGWMKAGSKAGNKFISRVLLENEDKVAGSIEKAVMRGLEKPHGLYFSLGEVNPHWEKGKKVIKKYLNKDANILDVGEQKIRHQRFGWYGEEREGLPSAGVAALQKLSEPDEFDVLSKMDKGELIAYIKREFPEVKNIDKYYDSYELLEVIGAQKAKKLGFDAIRQAKTKDKEMAEYIALSERAIK